MSFAMFMAIAQAAARLPSWMRLPLFMWKSPEGMKRKVALADEIVDVCCSLV